LKAKIWGGYETQRMKLVTFVEKPAFLGERKKSVYGASKVV
jgi:hypothetical protein